MAATAGAVVIGGFAPLAFGSTGSGSTATTLVTASFENTVHINRDGVKFQTKDPTDVRIQQFVFTPGSYSGWHHHPGLVLIAVQSGSLTFWDSECHSKTYGPGLPNGAVLIDGDDTPGQVTSATGATTYVTYVVPRASPAVFRIEDVAPPCAGGVAPSGGAEHER